MSALVAAAIVFVAFLWLTAKVRKYLGEAWFVVVLWRHFSGQPYHGKPMTDAGWLRKGQHALSGSKTGHPARWWHRPRWQRMMHRTGGTLTVGAEIWGLLVNPQVTIGINGAV